MTPHRAASERYRVYAEDELIDGAEAGVEEPDGVRIEDREADIEVGSDAGVEDGVAARGAARRRRLRVALIAVLGLMAVIALGRSVGSPEPTSPRAGAAQPASGARAAQVRPPSSQRLETVRPRPSAHASRRGRPSPAAPHAQLGAPAAISVEGKDILAGPVRATSETEAGARAPLEFGFERATERP
jgi:hypothetical protein